MTCILPSTAPCPQVSSRIHKLSYRKPLNLSRLKINDWMLVVMLGTTYILLGSSIIYTNENCLGSKKLPASYWRVSRSDCHALLSYIDWGSCLLDIKLFHAPCDNGWAPAWRTHTLSLPYSISWGDAAILQSPGDVCGGANAILVGRSHAKRQRWACCTCGLFLKKPLRFIRENIIPHCNQPGHSYPSSLVLGPSFATRLRLCPHSLRHRAARFP